jgi:hypothetical protein
MSINRLYKWVYTVLTAVNGYACTPTFFASALAIRITDEIDEPGVAVEVVHR